jgi:AraC-like DNA-binding protein
VADNDRLPEVRLAEAMPVRDRLAIYRDAVCRSLVSLSVGIPDGERFTAYVRARPLGVLRMTEVQSKPQVVHRTPRLINADDERYLKVGMLLTGRCVVTQHGREAALGPGDLVCYDTAAPYGFLMQSPFTLAVFMMPATHVEHRLRGFDQVTATAFSGREGLGAVIAEMLRALHAGSASITGEAALHVGDAAVNLVAGLVAQRSGRPLDENAGAAALRARVRQYIEEHLVDPGLTAADIAAACGISVRYLYKLFEFEGTAVSAWIRNRRLDQVERDLADPRLAHCSIAHIGARWGFADAPAFSRTFRARRGITAREFRALALRPPGHG